MFQGKNLSIHKDSLNDLKCRVEKLENYQYRTSKTTDKKIIWKSWFILIIILTGFLIGFTMYLPQTNSEKIQHISKVYTGYVIENLKGDKIFTWISWKNEPDMHFHVHIIDSPEITKERIQMINDVLFSEESLNINGKTYHKGWYGALKDVSQNTKFPIPINYHSIVTGIGSGQITIRLTNEISGDGYSGYTKSQADEINHQILKSQITIFSIDTLSKEEFKQILRHELGHALGLAHSNDPNDLMYPEIKNSYPYISPCDVQGMIGLYNGEQNSSFICQ